MRRLCSISKTRKKKKKYSTHYVEKEKEYLSFYNKNSHDVIEMLKHDGLEGRQLAIAKDTVMKKLYYNSKSSKNIGQSVGGLKHKN
jgi:hypothetical protein